MSENGTTWRNFENFFFEFFLLASLYVRKSDHGKAVGVGTRLGETEGSPKLLWEMFCFFLFFLAFWMCGAVGGGTGKA